MEKLDRKKNPQVEDIMVNTTFVMADAIDILIRNAEKRLYKRNAVTDDGRLFKDGREIK